MQNNPGGRKTRPLSTCDYTFPVAALVASAAYITAQLLADIGSIKIGRIGGWAVDLGTFMFPISFTLRDLVHKTLGRRGARTLILIGAGMNLIMAGYLKFCSWAPSDPSWGLGEEFTAVLRPVGRIVLASIAAQVCGQMVNTEIYHWFRSRITRRHQWLRVTFSNCIAIPVDSLVFVAIAFIGTLPAGTVVQILGVNIVIKLAVSVVGMPLIYTVRHVDRD